MSVIWVGGALLFYIRRERKPPLPLYETPFVTIIVPCYNEEGASPSPLAQQKKQSILILMKQQLRIYRMQGL